MFPLWIFSHIRITVTDIMFLKMCHSTDVIAHFYMGDGDYGICMQTVIIFLWL